MAKYIPFFFCMTIMACMQGATLPISFAFPTSKIRTTVGAKTRAFAQYRPNSSRRYMYEKEHELYDDYASSYFALTWKKGGWDCFRHYEILANGAIPYFMNLDKCPAKTMATLPKELIMKAMKMPGVTVTVPCDNGVCDWHNPIPAINFDLFDVGLYHQYAQELLEYTEQNLSTLALGHYLIKAAITHGMNNYTAHEQEVALNTLISEGKILYISGEPYPDYMRELTFIGLKEIFAKRCDEYVQIPHLYTSYDPANVPLLYGKGFGYTRILDDETYRTMKSEEAIRTTIRAGIYDFIIYGSVHRGQPFIEDVLEVVPAHKIIYICGEDCHHCDFIPPSAESLFFKRELG